MNKRMIRYQRLAVKVTLLVAALPLLQVNGCQGFGATVFQNWLNALPSAYFQTLFNFALLPIQLLLSGGTTTGNEQMI